MNKKILDLWPELEWIQDKIIRETAAKTWELALKKSALSAEDLHEIPFTLLVPNVKTTFMEHKRAVVHIAREAGGKFKEFLVKELELNMDVLIAGAILADVGKLLEYEKNDGEIIQGNYGKYLRHPFSGVSLAEQCGVPAPVCHIIASHAGEGDLVKRSVEAYIVHHADFMTYLPYKERLKVP